MPVPKIIHQTWKSAEVPAQWKAYQQKVKEFHPEWEYRLWTDAEIDDFVKTEFPDFYPVFSGLPKHIMRVDVIRYLIMYKIGGLYLDLDYEFIKPFDLTQYSLVLPRNRSLASGDPFDGIGNCIFASEPKHIFWKDVIDDLQKHPPQISHYIDVLDTTGPAYLTKIFYAKNYSGVYVPERMYFHPPTPKNKKDYNEILQNGISYGIHHCSGTWREERTWKHFVYKVKAFFRKM